MSRLFLLFSRRVPLYIWLPIVVACATAGFIASTLRPVRPIPNKPHISRSEWPSQAPVISSPEEQLTRTAGSQLSRALGPSRDAPSIALPTDEADLPRPAPSATERHQQVPDDVEESAPPAAATKGAPQRARPVRTDHSVAKARRPQRTVQQPVKAPTTSSAGLKNVPIIGPVFSLFQ